MDPDAGTSREFGTDVLVDILVRLPPSSRRRCRLVCRYWRDVVDTRTTEMQNRTKALIVATTESTYVVDDLSAWSRLRQLWTDDTARRCKGMSMVGTCNGLICLFDNRKPDIAITLANPVTGEMLPIPPLPLPLHCAPGLRWHYNCSFAYHPTTGRYKVVYIPCYFDQIWVFTLGEASWRDVATAGLGARRDLEAGIVSVDGATYWAVEGTEAKVMSFDLDDERVTSIRSLPAELSNPAGSWQLREVRGRLGIAVCHMSPTLEKTEVWVLEGARGEEKRWSRWYMVEMHRARNSLQGPRYLTRPQFAHGEYVLTWQRSWGGSYILYRHRLSDDTTKARHGVVENDERNRGTWVTYIDTCRTFSYVKTTEPLSFYGQSATVTDVGCNGSERGTRRKVWNVEA